jgi:hypothetical protein
VKRGRLIDQVVPDAVADAERDDLCLTLQLKESVSLGFDGVPVGFVVGHSLTTFSE